MKQLIRLVLTVAVAVACVLTVAGLNPGSSASRSPSLTNAVPEARCGPGDRPEPGIQGRVPLKQRESGATRRGYWCNLELLGRFQGEGSSWVSQSYRDCAYMSTRFPGSADHPGVQVIDVANPRNPRRVGALTDQAMLGTWETLKVNKARGLLAAVSAPSPGGNGLGFFAVYDISRNCAKPKLLSSVSNSDLTVPSNLIGHEGNWSPDGNTYWATSLSGGLITAIDVSDPSLPRVIFEGQTSAVNHGLSLSSDGRHLYVAKIGMGSGAPMDQNGVQIFDVSEVQERQPGAQMQLVGQTVWDDGAIGQHAIEVSWDGHPYLVYVDEGGAGAARIIDIADVRDPRVVAKLKLEVHQPQHADLRAKDTEGTGLFGYEGHYCDVDRKDDPTALACGYFQSGVRVFDVRDPLAPREIAYFNPPAQLGKNDQLASSEHAGGAVVAGGDTELNTDWCSSPPRFVGRQLWVTCQDNGFLALRFTHGVLGR